MNLFQSLYKAADLHGRSVLAFQPKDLTAHPLDVAAFDADLRAARRSWLDRLDDWFWRQDAKRREAYLAQSENLFDLEQRMRALERDGSRILFG